MKKHQRAARRYYLKAQQRRKIEYFGEEGLEALFSDFEKDPSKFTAREEDIPEDLKGLSLEEILNRLQR
jgi:superfamily I DNA and RNA helicase